jgi:hypothetical protein
MAAIPLVGAVFSVSIRSYEAEFRGFLLTDKSHTVILSPEDDILLFVRVIKPSLDFWNTTGIAQVSRAVMGTPVF